MLTERESWQREFLQFHRLDDSYLVSAQQWFEPFAASLVAACSGSPSPVLLGLNGSQGSGKSTLSDYLVALFDNRFQLSVVALSLDDFYFTHAEREHLAHTIHPLLITRGVPGTHDMGLLNSTLDALMASGKGAAVPVPRFNKALDDRRPSKEWTIFKGSPDVIILEGWCLGAGPQGEAQLAVPVNAFERNEDKQGIWRRYVNQVLSEQFVPLYQRVDLWAMLQAPSFSCVYRWRLQQEMKLAQSAIPNSSSKIMSEEEVLKFIQYYQRLTEHCLDTLPKKVNYLFKLDEERRVISSHS